MSKTSNKDGRKSKKPQHLSLVASILESRSPAEVQELQLKPVSSKENGGGTSSPTYPVSSFPSPSSFSLSMEFPALIVPTQRIGALRVELKPYLPSQIKLKVIHPLSPNDESPDQEDRNKFRKIVLAQRPDVFEIPAIKALLEKECRVSTHVVSTSYKDWTVDEVLRQILPVQDPPSAFESIGHIAHVNLREETLPFKFIIGKVILDKNLPQIQTIVNKVGTIETEYRTFAMEVIAGRQDEGWSNVSIKEDGCVYAMDFRKVYWNSRLGGEHRRLVQLIRADSERYTGEQKRIVADMMAGIGPFAVPLTSNGYNIAVHANDLNPSSYEYLVKNEKSNKCQQLHCYNMDGRDFVQKLQDEGIVFHHVLMNLPKTAPSFLDAFRGYKNKGLPRIHVHCFAPKTPEKAEKEILSRCSEALGCPIDPKECSVDIHAVRDIAPNKNMYCCSFTLPEAARSLNPLESSSSANATEMDGEQPDSKRLKTSS